ncbi:MAG: glucose 1-dehydrogenase [Chloracidobacterium sp.]|uniref:Glucose 1-dehydrogenase n=1 Tax=Chloracidobacterium validum TaxID=2821543 RepID=A0ABX8B951_9BACT|nr:glucose 1-dehydrogenase [Chloracidobacterium validum]QUW02185.1 glucose 1-dehydrogenase [Chloracidobacterium validum]
MTQTFQNTAVLVTGGASGIGRAIALAFAAAGAKTVVADQNAEGAAETVSQIEASGGQGISVVVDITDANAIADLVKTAAHAFGRLDVAVNNAGVLGTPAPLHDTDNAMFDQVLSVNLRGLFLCMKYEIHQMLKQGGGSIVNVASLAGLVGFSGFAPYAASKHAVLGLTKTAALEYAKSNIRVNAVCPSIIETPMTAASHIPPQLVEKYLNAHPMRRAGRPEEVASAVLWLASDGASFVNGTALTVDGGAFAQ